MITEKTTFQDGKLITLKTQDVSAHLDHVKHLAETHRQGGDFRFAGSIPTIVCEMWAKECGAAIGTAEFGEYVKRKLMDGDNSAFLVKGF